MRKFLLPAAAVFALIILGSCQKELSLTDVSNNNTDSSGSATSWLVKTYTETLTLASDSSSETYNLTYDANDRITSIVSTTNPGNKFVYQYSGNDSFTLTLYNSNAISIVGKNFIKNGLLDSIMQYNDTQDTTTQRYLYNANKQLTQLKDYEYYGGTSHLTATTFYTYDSDGNLATEQQGSDKTTYAYSTLPDNLNTGHVYGVKNKYLVKTTTATIGGVTYTLNHTYTFDSLNRQTSEKIVSSNGEIGVKTYTY